MNIFELYKLRYNLSNYLIFNNEEYSLLVENFIYWKLLIIIIFAIIIFVILINYNEINLISIFFIICSILFLYYSHNIEINLDNIKQNEQLKNYADYYKLANALFIESFNNLPNSNVIINNLLNINKFTLAEIAAEKTAAKGIIDAAQSIIVAAKTEEKKVTEIALVARYTAAEASKKATNAKKTLDDAQTDAQLKDNEATLLENDANLLEDTAATARKTANTAAQYLANRGRPRIKEEKIADEAEEAATNKRTEATNARTEATNAATIATNAKIEYDIAVLDATDKLKNATRLEIDKQIAKDTVATAETNKANKEKTTLTPPQREAAINLTENIPTQLVNNNTFMNFYDNFVNILNKLIINIKFNENMLNEDFNNFYNTNINNGDILKYVDVSDYNSSFKAIKNLYFLKISETDEYFKNSYTTHNNTEFYTQNRTLLKINEFIFKLNAEHINNFNYYLINLDILEKCINENVVDNIISSYLTKIYNDLIKKINDTYNLKVENFKLLNNEKVLNNNNFKLKITKLIKEFNNNFFKMLLLFIYFFIVILHVFYTKIITPSYYISFIFYILLFLLFIIIFYNSIYSKII